jgi:hypothetical protein
LCNGGCARLHQDFCCSFGIFKSKVHMLTSSDYG